jgi:hypothetical protein
MLPLIVQRPSAGQKIALWRVFCPKAYISLSGPFFGHHRAFRAISIIWHFFENGQETGLNVIERDRLKSESFAFILELLTYEARASKRAKPKIQTIILC